MVDSVLELEATKQRVPTNAYKAEHVEVGQPGQELMRLAASEDIAQQGAATGLIGGFQEPVAEDASGNLGCRVRQDQLRAAFLKIFHQDIPLV